MNLISKHIAFTSLILLIISLLSMYATPQSNLLKYYEYNTDMPLNPKIQKIDEKKNYIQYKVYYTSINNQTVPALLFIPKTDTPPYPCIIFLHGYGGKKEDAALLAKEVTSQGYAVFSIDAPLHGERRQPGKQLYSPDINATKQGFIQAVIDLRRAVDLLETIPKIDKDRIGYAGGSMGGIIGAIFISVEPRIKAAVLVVPGGNMSLMIQKSQHSAIPPIREYLKEQGISYDELQKTLDPIDPINFIHLYSPRPLQIHLGKNDMIVPAEAGKQLAEKAGQPKEIYWYNAGHGLPLDIVLARALDFFDKHLKGTKPSISREFKVQLIRNIPLIILFLTIITLAILIKKNMIGQSKQ